MSEDDLRTAIARPIYDILEGPVNNQDFGRQTRQWEMSLSLADAAIAAYRKHPDGAAADWIAGRDAAADVAVNYEPAYFRNFHAEYEPDSTDSAAAGIASAIRALAPPEPAP